MRPGPVVEAVQEEWPPADCLERTGPGLIWRGGGSNTGGAAHQTLLQSEHPEKQVTFSLLTRERK